MFPIPNVVDTQSESVVERGAATHPHSAKAVRQTAPIVSEILNEPSSVVESDKEDLVIRVDLPQKPLDM